MPRSGLIRIVVAGTRAPPGDGTFAPDDRFKYQTAGNKETSNVKVKENRRNCFCKIGLAHSLRLVAETSCAWQTRKFPGQHPASYRFDLSPLTVEFGN